MAVIGNNRQLNGAVSQRFIKNLNIRNLHQTEWNKNNSSKLEKKVYSKHKSRDGWTNLKKIETDCNVIYKTFLA